jgi:hypothetical protein
MAYLTAYIAGGAAYTVAMSYFDATKEIMRFREGNLSHYKVHTDIEAGWHGVEQGIPANIMTAFVWPIMVPLVTLPYLAVKMNPKPSTDHEPLINH